jgi:hypothetical protein
VFDYGDGSRGYGLTGVSVSLAGEVLFADVLLLPNGMSKVGAYT